MKTLIPKPSTKPARNTPTYITDKHQFHHELEVDVLARTIWGEARGEGSVGMEAVACVVLNRVRIAQKLKGYWWGNDVIQVCHKPYQFSCWNKDDPNYHEVSTVDETNIYFVTAKRIARRALNKRLEDPTAGATHYHTAGISPYWAKNKKPVCVIGHHIFYKLIEL